MRQIQKHSLILAGICLLWFAAHAAVKPTQGTGRVVEDFRGIPLQLDGWSGVRGKFDELSIEALKHCALMTTDYEDEQGNDSNLSIVYGVDLGDFHQPEVCMEGQGWRRITSRRLRLPGAKSHDAVMLHMTNDYQSIVVLYWFASQDGASTALDRHKLFAFADRLRHGRLKPSAMIRFITPVESDWRTAEQVTLDLASKLDRHISKVLAAPPVFESTGRKQLEE